MLEAVDLPEKVLVKHPAGVGEDEQALVRPRSFKLGVASSPVQVIKC